VLRQGLIGSVATLVLASTSLAQAAAAPATPAAAPAAAPAPAAGGAAAGQTPIQMEAAAAKGTLKNPYTDDNKEITEEGHKLFMNYSCNGCHGGTGGGGMCPPLINDTWVYNGDDDTLFRLVTLGSVALQAKGYTRRGRENVVAPMPPFGGLIPTGDELWKILAWVRSAYNGDPKYKFGSPPPPPPPPDG
jgi:mono/diheme cytochrome c family protein